MTHQPLPPSRQFAREAAQPASAPPDPLTTVERRRLSQEALQERILDEVAYVNGLYVPTPRQQQCQQAVETHLRAASTGLPGAHDSLYVLGDTGLGKSTGVRRAAKEIHNRICAEFGQAGQMSPEVRTEAASDDLVPVVWLTLREGGWTKSVVAQFTDYLGYGTRHDGVDLFNHLVRHVDRHHITLVVLDDVNNLPTHRSDGHRILNTVKNLNTDLGYLGVCFVYIGLPDQSGRGNLLENRQLEQRLVPFEFEAFDFDLHARDFPPENLAWRDYLDDWERALAPVLADMEPGDISSLLAVRLWNRSHGSPGAITGLLRRAVTETLCQTLGQGRLTLTRSRVEQTPVPARYTRPMVAT